MKTYLNILMEAQPRTMRKFFNTDNVSNGLVDCVNFIEPADNATFAQTAETVNIYDHLPAEFTVSDVIAVERQHGISDCNPSQKVVRWRKRGYIVDSGRMKGHSKVYIKKLDKIVA